MTQSPAPHKLAVAIFGATLLPLSVINAFAGFLPFPRTLLQFLLLLVVAILCIGYGREWRRIPWASRTVRLIAYSPIIAPVLLVVILHIPVQPLGRHDARQDLAKGVYKVTLGHQPWSKEASRMLADRYGITSTISGGCLTTSFESTYRSGYASIVKPALYEKYGRDVVAETLREARTNWQTSHSAPPLPNAPPKQMPDAATSGS